MRSRTNADTMSEIEQRCQESIRNDQGCDSAMTTGLEDILLVAWDELPMYPRVAQALAGLVLAYPGLWYLTPLA